MHVQVHLCSLSGDIFPKQVHYRTEAETTKAAYLARLIHAVVRWITPVQAVLSRAQNDEAELLDACRYDVGAGLPLRSEEQRIVGDAFYHCKVCQQCSC